jgi:guanylate kinase
MKGSFIIVSAPSGAGKTTIVRRLLGAGLGLEFSVSAASRAPRPHEVDGRDYHFISAGRFRELIAENALIEWQEVYPDHYYGTLRSEVDRIRANGNSVIFDLDVKGGMNLKKLYPNISLSLFVMPPSVDELEKRLRRRSTETEEKLQMRLMKAKQELQFAEGFDRIIVNDNLETAVAEAIAAVREFLGK